MTEYRLTANERTRIWYPSPERGVGELPELDNHLEPRSVALDDVAMHQRIFNEIDLPEQYENSLLGPAKLEEFLEMCRNAKHIEVVINNLGADSEPNNSLLAGYAIMGDALIKKPLMIRGLFDPESTSELQSLVVASDQTSQGIGAWLLGACELVAQKQGATNMLLKTHTQNKSLNFYQAHGYTMQFLESLPLGLGGRWLLSKPIGTPEAIRQAQERIKRNQTVDRLNSKLTQSIHQPLSVDESKKRIGAHITQFFEKEHINAEELSPAQRSRIIGSLVMGDVRPPLKLDEEYYSRSEYAAKLLGINKDELFENEAYINILHYHHFYAGKSIPPPFVSDLNSNKPCPANMPLDLSLEVPLIKSRLANSIDHEHVYGLYRSLATRLRELAKEYPPAYIPIQMSKLVEWLDESYCQIPHRNYKKRMATEESMLAVFTQLAYCPDHVEAFLNMPVVQHAEVVKQQAVLNSVALRLWNHSSKTETVTRLLRFAQEHAPNSQEAAQEFTTYILEFLQPGRERQMVELIEQLPSVLPEAECQELFSRLETNGLWQVALKVGKNNR